ncbi:MAG: hypothetical protein KC978_24445, partial [Candidatus Omnitrophica bacterium]|nr:hypothetical protein [Candidatus Omnitrophota bacterium]
AVLSWQERDYNAQLAKWEVKREEIDQEIEAYRPTLIEKLPAWEQEQEVAEVEWELLRPTSMASIGGATFEVLEDGSIFVGGNNPSADEYILVFPTDLPGITGFRLEAITDPALPRNGPGRARHGNFLLTEFHVKARKKTNPKMEEEIKFSEAIADYSQEGYEVSLAIDGKEETGWSIDAWRDPSLNVDRGALFIAEEQTGFEEGTILQVRLDFSYGNNHGLGRFRLYAATGPKEHLNLPPAIPAILATAPEARTEDQQNQLLDYFGQVDPESKKLVEKRTAHKNAKPNPPDTKAQTIAANPEPPTTHIHTRGDFLRPGDPVQPSTLAVLQPFEPRIEPEQKQPDRLDLAKWIVDKENPLTARVAV